MIWENILKRKYKPRICRICGEDDETVSSKETHMHPSSRQICQMCADKKFDEWYERISEEEEER